tara:strand:+ start:827 stop:1825 length:999 start_codon:yes stop_codon:yes gene_type:complete
MLNGEWEILISKFRKLGGVADNICQRDGSKGRGIFPVNEGIKSKIFTPSNLIIRKDDIFLDDGKIRIKEEKQRYNNETREFFNYYQDHFSWGGGGKENTEAFENSLSLFSSELKSLLKNNRLVDIDQRHQGSWKDVILSQFLYAREFNFRNELQIVPLLELVNHDVISFQFYKSSSGISSPNYPPLSKELTYTYGNNSSLSCLFNYGFFSKETIVFSLPFNLSIKDMGITLMCKGKELKDDHMRIERSGEVILIEGLPIADKNSPSLPESYFRELIEQIGGIDFSILPLLNIINFNNSIRKEILSHLNSINNKASFMLEKVINYELELISNF